MREHIRCGFDAGTSTTTMDGWCPDQDLDSVELVNRPVNPDRELIVECLFHSLDHDKFSSPQKDRHVAPVLARKATDPGRQAKGVDVEGVAEDAGKK